MCGVIFTTVVVSLQKALRASDDLIFLNVHPNKDGSLSFENPRAFQGKGVTTWEGLIKSVRAKVKRYKSENTFGSFQWRMESDGGDETLVRRLQRT